MTVLLRAVGLTLCGAILIAFSSAFAQQQPSVMLRHRTRLYLKDHSYQIVMSYRVQGDRVLFVSAERDGVEEDIPTALIDFDATHRWEKEHPAAANGEDSAQEPASLPAIDPELLKEERQRRALSPEVAPDLHLPEQDSVVALDSFQGTQELVPLVQSASDLNQVTGHGILRSSINPMASAHQIVQLLGERAAIQLHVNQPVLYLRTGTDAGVTTGGTPLIVDTHGASSTGSANPANLTDPAESQYVVVRVDVRRGIRVVSSFHPDRLSGAHPVEEVVETTKEVLPGGNWLKVTPRSALSFGEYALVEVLSDREINLSVWDFGVHPTSPENLDVLKPEPKRPLTLERRNTP